LKTIYSGAPRFLSLLAVCVAAAEVLLDWTTHIQLNVSIIYSIPLVLAALSRRRQLLWSLLAILVCMVFAVYVAQIGPGAFSLQEPYLRNRVLSSITMLITATLLHVWTRALDTLDERDRVLKDQNGRLQAAYRELEGYQQQIERHSQELEQRRAQAEAASERKTTLLATLSHDIRNPLAAISYTAQAIELTVASAGYGGNVTILAKQLSANIASVANLISDILDFSALELGRVELHPSDFALEELIRDECRVLLPLAQAKQLHLITEPMRQSVRLHADPIKLGRVLANLIVNAIKYTKQGFVRIEAGCSNEGGAWLRVRDSGIGILCSDRERIFDEFAQLHDPRSGRGKGYGLGLSICRKLVTMMGGTIGVESSSTSGSVFIVYLPSTCVVEMVEPQGPFKATAVQDTSGVGHPDAAS
jgi:signal transduction histidine kinase